MKTKHNNYKILYKTTSELYIDFADIWIYYKNKLIKHIELLNGTIHPEG